MTYKNTVNQTLLYWWSKNPLLIDHQFYEISSNYKNRAMKMFRTSYAYSVEQKYDDKIESKGEIKEVLQELH